ncbi:MAG: ChaN family lipoprotein [Nitrospirota bacterium]
MRIRTFIAPIALSFLGLLVLTAAVDVDERGDVYRLSDKKTISFSHMVQDVKKADFIVVGEVHDIPEHHQLQLDIIRAFHESGAPLAIGLEMFRTESQNALDSWVKGVLPVHRFISVYYENWRMAWPLYRDIFTYAHDHQIPMLGLNLPSSITELVARQGFASLKEKEKKQLPPGISCDIDPTYMEFIRRAYAVHQQKADERFVHFCEAQMVWDKSMAWRLIEYRKTHPDQKVVVLAGVGHAWKRGIPEQIARGSKYAVKVVMPIVPDEIDEDTVSIRDTDYLLLR